MDKCLYYNAARRQRQIEIERGDGLRGVSSYYHKGCLNGCDGYDKGCEKFIVAQRATRRIEE